MLNSHTSDTSITRTLTSFTGARTTSTFIASTDRDRPGNEQKTQHPDGTYTWTTAFNDPAADAREAYEAVRGLAHATQRIENPEVLYPVIGELMATTRNLSQVLDQLARAQQQRQAHADLLAQRTELAHQHVGAQVGITAPGMATWSTRSARILPT